MRTNHWRILGLTLLVGACDTGKPASHATDRARELEAHVVPGVLAVDWKDGTTKAQFDAEEKTFGIDVELNSPNAADEAFTIARNVEITPDLLKRLRADPLVEHAEAVYTYDATFVPDDPEFKLQWHMAQVRAPEAWEWGAGEGVIVAVIDTGVAKVPDLAATTVLEGYDFVNDDTDAEDDQGHGTHVAGTIAQSTHNGVGVAGLAHRASILPVKVLDANGGGTTIDIADGIRWAVDHGAKVLNLSLGGGGYSEILADAVAYAHRKGAVVVCAAGNGSGAPVSFPAAYEGAFAVSAIRFDKHLAPYSSFGEGLDIAAPGGDKSVDQNGDGQPDGVLQQTIGGKYEWFQGTSMATPHVAGAAALLAGAGVTRAGAIEDVLRSTAVPLGDANKFGAGALDAAAAVKRVREWGGLWRFGIAAILGLFATAFLRRRDGGRTRKLGVSGVVALALASCGLLLLPVAGVGHPAVSAFFATPIPEWGMVLTGAMTSSPLWLSAFLPIVAFGVSRWTPATGAMAGLAIGYAAYLLHAAVVGWVDIAWIPGRPVEAVWLVVNGGLAFLCGLAILQRRGLETV